MQPQTRRILIINGKGGCGKTTVATNLAVAYAKAGHGVALFDHDPQGSSTFWASQRPTDLPPIHLVPTHKRSNMYQTTVFQNRLTADVDRVIIDGPSNARDHDLELLLKQSDTVLIPLQPSSIDMHAAGRFITDLIAHRVFRAAPRTVGIIANRIQPTTAAHAKLKDFLASLDVPTVATFRDSPVYMEAAEEGRGIVDKIESRAARKETSSWLELVRWIDAQAQSATTQVRNLRHRPLPAERRRQSDQMLRA